MPCRSGGVALIVEVSTLDDERLDAYARLTEAQLRSKLEPERALFIAESGKVIERALAGGMEPLSLLMEEKWRVPMQPIIDEVAARWGEGVPVFVAPHDELAKLTGFELTRGALGAFRRPALPSVADVVAGARRIAVLEDITNHTNVGAIFRSAAALGVDAVLVTPACYDPLYRRAVRVSMGTVFQVPWTRIGAADVGEDAVSGRAADAGSWAVEDSTSAGAREAGAGADAAGARAVDGRAADAMGVGAVGEGTADVAGVHAVATRATGADAAGAHAPASRAAGVGGWAVKGVHTADAHVAGAGSRATDAGGWAVEGVPLLHELGFKTAAMALSDASVPLDDPALNAEERLAIVLGTEGDGLARDTIARCDYTVRIPMARGVDSLNVAAASAVAFWQLRARA